MIFSHDFDEQISIAISAAFHQLSIDDLTFVKEKHPLPVLAPVEPLNIEFSVLHLEGTLQNDPIFPEKHLLSGRSNTQIVLVFVPFDHFY